MKSHYRLLRFIGQQLRGLVVPKKPMISVVVPTHDRPIHLTRLMQSLSRQRFRNFEVVIVDQSEETWPDEKRDFGFKITYVRSERKGACNARNIGADVASGDIIAFTDDDCEASTNWLRAAAKEMNRSAIVGLEGLVESDRHNDPNWRPVTNKGVEGIGFMTANLFIRREVFRAAGGFDLGFENPHFREDTDFGWRAQVFGKIKFSHKAWVYHPPHSRLLERESAATRSSFFVNDGRLLRKWPKKYVQLFLAEGHWKVNPLFWNYFLEGVRREKVELPEEIHAILVANAPHEAARHLSMIADNTAKLH